MMTRIVKTVRQAVCGAVMAVFLCGTAVAQVNQAYSTAATGTWTTPATWSKASADVPDYPVSGDTINWVSGYQITVSAGSPQVFSGGSSSGIHSFVSLNAALTMDVGTFTYLTPATNLLLAAVNDGGSWVNQGTFNHTNNNTFYVDRWGTNNVPAGFTNDGDFNLTGGGFVQLRQQGGGTTSPGRFFNNDTISATASGGSFTNGSAIYDVAIVNAATGLIQADGATLNIRARLIDNGGTLSAINNGTIRFDGASLYGGHQTSDDTQFIAESGSTIQLAGNIAALRGKISGNVTLARWPVASSSSGYIDLDSQIDWVGANNDSQFVIAAGQTLEFRSPLRFTGAGGYTIKPSGTGTLKNAAGNTITMTNGSTFYLDTGIFENDGLIDVTGGTNLNLRGATFQNDGTYRVSGTNVTWGYSAGAFQNTGTVEVSQATFTVPAAVNATQFVSGNTLTNGTWSVQAGASGATLNLDPANAGITTIGPAATVILGSTGAGVATFAEMGGLATVQGTLLVNGTMNYSSTAAGLAVNGGTVGGTGRISETITVTGGTVAPGASAGSTEISGALSLDDASTTQIELGGTVFTFNDTEEYDRIKVSGTTTLDGALDLVLLDGFTPAEGNLFGILDAVGGLSGTFAGLPEGAAVWNSGLTYLFITYAGLVDDASVALFGGNDVVLYSVVIPEPASVALLLSGAVLALRRRRAAVDRVPRG